MPLNGVVSSSAVRMVKPGMVTIGGHKVKAGPGTLVIQPLGGSASNVRSR